MIRIAIPVDKGILSPHFGHASEFMFFDVEDKKIVATETTQTPEHMEGSFPEWIKSKNADMLIVSGIGPKAVDILNAANIEVITNAVPESPRKIVEDFINNKLDRTYEDVCEHNHNN